MRYLIVTLILCLIAVSSNADEKVIKITKNSDINYVTVTVPQGIQFPVPKSWQNITPQFVDVADFLKENMLLGGTPSFAARGFDDSQKPIGKITLTFLDNIKIGQKLFSQLIDNDLNILDQQLYKANKAVIKQLGGQIFQYNSLRAKINGKFYHVITSTRQNPPDLNGERQDVFVINLRYYDFENSFSLFISSPAAASYELLPILGKIYSELESSIEEGANISKVKLNMNDHPLEVLSRSIPYELLETNKEVSVSLNNIDDQLELMSKFCEKEKTELKWQDFYYPPLLRTSFADYVTRIEDGGGFSPNDFEAAGIIFLPDDPCLTTRFAKLSPKVNERVKSFLKIHGYNKQGEIYSRDNECHAKNGTEAHHLILFSDGKANQNFYLEEDILSVWGDQDDIQDSNFLSLGPIQEKQDKTEYESIVNFSLGEDNLGTLIQLEFPNLAANTNNIKKFEELFATDNEHLKAEVSLRFGKTWFETSAWHFPQYDNLSIATYLNGTKFSTIVRLIYPHEFIALRAKEILDTRLKLKLPQRQTDRTFNDLFLQRDISILSYLNYVKLKSDNKIILEYHFNNRSEESASTSNCLSNYRHHQYLLSDLVRRSPLFNNLLPSIKNLYNP